MSSVHLPAGQQLWPGRGTDTGLHTARPRVERALPAASLSAGRECTRSCMLTVSAVVKRVERKRCLCCCVLIGTGLVMVRAAGMLPFVLLGPAAAATLAVQPTGQTQAELSQLARHMNNVPSVWPGRPLQACCPGRRQLHHPRAGSPAAPGPCVLNTQTGCRVVSQAQVMASKSLGTATLNESASLAPAFLARWRRGRGEHAKASMPAS